MKYINLQIKDLSKAKTFDEWLELGRCVRKGQKTLGFKNNKAVFVRDQTDQIEFRHGDPMDDPELDHSWDEDDDFPAPDMWFDSF